MATSVAALVLAVALVAAATACGSSDTAKKVDLDRRIDLPGVRATGEREPTSASQPLRIAIAGLLSPMETLSGYKGFLSYLEGKLGQPVKLVQRGTYAEVNALIQTRQVDMALVCPLPYIQGHRAFGMELVAAAAHRGEAAHYSYLVVAASSGITSLGQLRGRSLAFSDPNSNSGWLALAYQLALEGETPNSFFGGYIFTHHHNESLQAVASRLVDGAAVDSLTYNYLAATAPDLVSRVRVIARWGPYPSPPFVVRPDLDPDLKARFRRILLTMDQDPQGQKVLRNLQLDGFAALEDSAYDLIRSMEARVRSLDSLRR